MIGTIYNNNFIISLQYYRFSPQLFLRALQDNILHDVFQQISRRPLMETFMKVILLSKYFLIKN